MASARAIATRCCSPPDSSCGRWRARSARPTSSSSSRTRASRSRGSAPTRRSGISTFSAADRIGSRPNAWKMNPIVRRRNATRSLLGHLGHRQARRRGRCRSSAGRGRRSARGASSCRSPTGRERRPAGPARPGGVTPSTARTIRPPTCELADEVDGSRRRSRSRSPSVRSDRASSSRAVPWRRPSSGGPVPVLGACAVGPDLDVVVLEHEPDPPLEAERLDVRSRQLQPPDPVEHGVLLGDHVMVAAPR